MTRFAFTGAPVILAALLATSPAQAQGNKVLMDEWVRNKQQARDEVLKELKRQGALPRNGTVTFEATVKPDPKRQGAPKVRIDSVVVREAPSGQKAQAADPVFGPRDPATGHPVAPAAAKPDTVHETVTIKDGVPQGAKP